MTVFEQLQGTIAATLKVSPDSIRATTKAEDIPAWDSLGHINLMMTIEQTFDVLLDVEDFDQLNSLPAMIDYLKRQGID